MKTEVKICGLTNDGDARAALECGADYIGFVLYPKSPRFVSPDAMKDILNKLSGTFRAVAVVVNLERERIAEILRDCPLYAIQFHGDEEPGVAVDLGVEIWRSVHLEDGSFQPDPDSWPADRYVVDGSSRRDRTYGGTGIQIDLSSAASFAKRYASMLSGGLACSNVANAIRGVRPSGVDVSSGIEKEPGLKNVQQMARFIEIVRQMSETGSQ